MTYAEKQKVKCKSCGTETSRDNLTLVKIKGIIQWWCTICKSRRDKLNG